MTDVQRPSCWESTARCMGDVGHQVWETGSWAASGAWDLTTRAASGGWELTGRAASASWDWMKWAAENGWDLAGRAARAGWEYAQIAAGKGWEFAQFAGGKLRDFAYVLLDCAKWGVGKLLEGGSWLLSKIAELWASFRQLINDNPEAARGFAGGCVIGVVVALVASMVCRGRSNAP